MGINLYFSHGIKPTTYKCHCIKCKKEIKKGQKRFEISADGYKQSNSWYYHELCFLKEVKKMLGAKQKDKWLQGVYLGIQLMEP